MLDKAAQPRITSDSRILASKPVSLGTRISVQLLKEKLHDGWTVDNLLEDYPPLTREQIRAALDYAADAMRI